LQPFPTESREIHSSLTLLNENPSKSVRLDLLFALPFFFLFMFNHCSSAETVVFFSSSSPEGALCSFVEQRFFVHAGYGFVKSGTVKVAPSL
jgi:hypothetical protein